MRNYLPKIKVFFLIISFLIGIITFMKVNGLQLKRNIFGEPEKLNEYPLNTVRQPLNKNIGRENDQDFESKTWNRSKSIGFLRKITFFIFSVRLLQIVENVAELQLTELSVRLFNLCQKRKLTRILEICITTGRTLSFLKKTQSSR